MCLFFFTKKKYYHLLQFFVCNCMEDFSPSHPNRYRRMLEVRKKLPSYKMRDEIVDTIKKNQVVVLSGETGECCWVKLSLHFFFYMCVCVISVYKDQARSEKMLKTPVITMYKQEKNLGNFHNFLVFLSFSITFINLF